MRLQGISIDVVRNEYEYNEYVSASYREQYSYEDSKPSLPWIIIRFVKSAYAEDMIGKSVMRMIPAADFTNISAAPSGQWFVDEADKSRLKLDLSKEGFNSLMLEVKKDCGFDSLPEELHVIVEDNNGFEYVASEESVNINDVTAVLEKIDKECIQQGGGYLAKVVYEIIASGKLDKTQEGGSGEGSDINAILLE